MALIYWPCLFVYLFQLPARILVRAWYLLSMVFVKPRSSFVLFSDVVLFSGLTSFIDELEWCYTVIHMSVKGLALCMIMPHYINIAEIENVQSDLKVWYDHMPHKISTLLHRSQRHIYFRLLDTGENLI